ncbi:LysR family transcriptional regulator [Kaustia mangrovi]|uniref:LysR family transcriptional regulator n=1 Tax=Kaustia mangrovi TaxID=2593653 RepID=A0A7S8HBE9_9HYPH|nr:LysR substrate-binding domain-containing protein [Kaustia mangrovi]QPC42525.1 LysR family transcriptional regulator [Kaustia mangrovi]
MVQENETTNIVEGRDPANRTLNLDALRSFVAICETGSFRRAALRVRKSPSAVSLQIGKLEDLLGARLLDRDARHVTLTDHGGTLLGQARRLLGLNDETLAYFQGSPLAGRLCLSAPHDLGVSLVPGLLRRLAEVHPGVHVDVRLGTSEAVQKGIADGSVNLALFNDVGASAIRATDLFSEPLKWLVLDGGRAVRQDPLPLAVAEVGCAWREAALNALQATGRAYRVAYSSDTSMGQVAALRADLAVAALPLSLADRDLVEAPSHCDLPQLPLTHIRLADDGSDLARAFVALVAADIASPRPGR